MFGVPEILSGPLYAFEVSNPEGMYWDIAYKFDFVIFHSLCGSI